MKKYLLLSITLSLVCLSSQFSRAQEPVDFTRQIKPILAENCFACHGMDAETRAADLRLDEREAAIDYGAIVPEEPAESSLVERIFETDSGSIMPPPESHKQLTDEQKELLKRWIAEGAEYQQHWSLIAPQKSATPPVKNEVWCRNEIDRFVLAKLESKQLAPNSDAPPETFFRRLNLDLCGLPPTPEETTKFVADYQAHGEDAVSQWIDHLMARPTWGEHRARYWLDAARYADTHGMHFDNYREMWPYRDWVIRSFNANQSFDQFTVEQLAGDLLENPTLDQKIATGFQRCNMTTNEGGTIDEENLAIYAADRVQTFGWVYLGLTTNCCQCHDHKFDPISIKDYYSLAAFFRNQDQPAKDGNNKRGDGPVVTVPRPADQTRMLALPAEIAERKAERNQHLSAARPNLDKWLAQLDVDTIGSVPNDGLILHLPINEGQGNSLQNGLPKKSQLETKTSTSSDAAKSEITPVSARLPAGNAIIAGYDLTWEPDGLIGPTTRINKEQTIEVGDFGDFAFDQPHTISCWVKTTRNMNGAFVARMDPGQHHRGWDVGQNEGEFITHFIDSWPDNALKISTTGNQVKQNQWQHVVVTWSGGGKPEDLKIYVDGKLTATKIDSNSLQKTVDTRIQTSLLLGSRAGGDYAFDGYLQDLMLFQRQLTAEEIANLADSTAIRVALNAKPDQRTDQQRDQLLRYYLYTKDPKFVALEKQLSDLESEKAAIESRSPITHVMTENTTPAMTNVLIRGAYDKVGEEVPAAPPLALHAMPAGAPANRLGLAQWVVDANNPLTARVTVNRFWAEVFGQGIVATSEDFGVMGAPPVNQELLDWLAVDFQQSGWDVKRLFKQMLMSSAYRQSPVATAEKIELDRDNSLLSRGPRFRMDAEMVRDYALFSSGLLNEQMFGPGIRPYQPDNLWEIVGLPGGDTRKYVVDSGDAVYRRSLYSFWKRMSPPPNLEAFNAPNREVCTVRRERTNTPLQALVTLNDPQFFEAARVLAQSALKQCGNDQKQILEFLSARTVCRPFQPEEEKILDENLSQFLEAYRNDPAAADSALSVGPAALDENLDKISLAAWTMVCNQLLNLDEVLNK